MFRLRKVAIRSALGCQFLAHYRPHNPNVIPPPSLPSACTEFQLPLHVQAEGGGKKERFVLSVAFSPDKQLLAAGAMDGTIAGAGWKQYRWDSAVQYSASGGSGVYTAQRGHVRRVMGVVCRQELWTGQGQARNNMVHNRDSAVQWTMQYSGQCSTVDNAVQWTVHYSGQCITYRAVLQ